MSGRTDRSRPASQPAPRPTTELVIDERDASGATPSGETPLVVVGFTAADAERARTATHERATWFVDATPREQPVATDADAAFRVEPAGPPGDLTGVGVGIERACAAIEGAPHCWVPSLTALLQYVERDAAYRFCNAVVNRVAAVDGTVELRLDEAAHDERVLATFASLADTVARETETPRS